MSNFSNFDKKFEFTTQYPTTKTCPYCGVKLAKIPKRKKKCPNCENYIFVRKSKLYTKEEKDIRDFLEHYEGYGGITRKIFNETREKLSSKFGLVASVKDTAEHVLFEINTQRTSETFAEWKSQGVIKNVEWHTANDDLVCNVCKERAGKEFLLDKIQTLLPAHDDCRCWVTPIVDRKLSQKRLKDTLSKFGI